MLLRSLIHNFLLHQHHLITLLAVMEPDAVGNCIFALLVENVCAIRYMECTIGPAQILENITALPVSVMEYRDRLFIAVELRHLIDIPVERLIFPFCPIELKDAIGCAPEADDADKTVPPLAGIPDGL